MDIQIFPLADIGETRLGIDTENMEKLGAKELCK